MGENQKDSIRVRMAPSPTGPLHFGTARTAFFNWLFVRNQGGKLILRIEDTDIERSTKEFEKDIIEGLQWLGINWDEGPVIGGPFGPYKQSERGDYYEKYLKKLLDEEGAYYCFCSKEELEKDRQAMLSQGLVPKYSGKCRSLTREKSFEMAKEKPAVIRIKMPESDIEFVDLIRGRILVNGGLIGDIVIARNLKSPLFIFAGVVDDYEMKISHVIRGEDHISNTPKQIIIQKALGFNEVKYVHLPLVLAPDRSKLSKRYIETSLNDYKKQGYLPEAILNFMALLGWHPKDDREFLFKEELIKEFDIKRVQKAGAVFNIEKLGWLNSQHLRNFSEEDLYQKLVDFIPEDWKRKKDLLIKIIRIEKERLKILSEFIEIAGFFIELEEYDKNLLVWKNSSEEKAKDNLNAVLEVINKIPDADFEQKVLEKVIMPIAEIRGRGEVLWPLRAALSGKSASPGPFEILEVLGKEESIKRIKSAINKLP